ncbi:MAG: PP2C family serine/threonine-protein phosphatase [Microbacteriaceae bacterium]
MTPTRAAALTHVGKIRANNQDSGYRGKHLFVVADGMGGHAGGDVASAIALNRLLEVDKVYQRAEDAQFAMQSALIAANSLLAESVFEHPELTGMGTTVSALLRVGDRVAIAHIGDSRIYLFRDGDLNQASTDHTFVQRLVESGRITEEEAMVHPRRSVLMRVLGDVDSSPEIDTWVLDTRPGDRWLICSDGLSGILKAPAIAEALSSIDEPRVVAERLIQQTLDAGAPDNVTVVILDVNDDEVPAGEPELVGSAALPLAFDPEPAKARSLRLPSLRLHGPRPATGPTHFEPESEDYLDELIEEDARRVRRRKATWLVGIGLLVLAIVLATVLGYQWTQTHYYVGSTPTGNVAIYQGIQQGIGPIPLSHVYDETSLPTDQLTGYNRQLVKRTIDATSLADAQRIVRQLTDASSQ